VHPNEELIARFYSALGRRDAAEMGACYHADVTFSDPAFPDLHGDRARAMWAMLAERGSDLTVEFSGVTADDATGAAHWEARYTFSMTGKKVHNVIDARFAFRDGLIFTHTDTFDFHRWAGQALGVSGKLLGGTSFLQKKVQSTGAKALDAFIAKSG
jgi:ketosteroid isomerase-like protein